MSQNEFSKSINLSRLLPIKASQAVFEIKPLHIEFVLNDFSTRKTSIGKDRMLYTHEPSHTVVLHNPNAIDGGTVFQPKGSMTEFLKERGWH